MNRSFFVVALLLAWPLSLCAEDSVFSGPQAGEKMSAFKVRGVLGTDAGKELDFVTQAGKKPIVLIFVHDLTRPSMAMVRTLSGYTVTRAKDGLSTGIVWLDDDATAAEAAVKRVQHALTPNAPIGVSLDGREGPGSYGLNRKVMLTILVGTEGKVTANFALIQPSLQADLPKILEQIVKLVGGPLPKLDELPQMAGMARQSGSAPKQDERLRELIRPVINKNATAEEVDKAAKVVEAYAEKNAAARTEIGRIATTIVNSGKLSNYGTETAQTYLKKWAKDHGVPTKAAAGEPPAPESKPAPSTKPGDR